jgi:hypothetical protein
MRKYIAMLWRKLHLRRSASNSVIVYFDSGWNGDQLGSDGGSYTWSPGAWLEVPPMQSEDANKPAKPENLAGEDGQS